MIAAHRNNFYLFSEDKLFPSSDPDTILDDLMSGKSCGDVYFDMNDVRARTVASHIAKHGRMFKNIQTTKFYVNSLRGLPLELLNNMTIEVIFDVGKKVNIPVPDIKDITKFKEWLKSADKIGAISELEKLFKFMAAQDVYEVFQDLSLIREISEVIYWLADKYDTCRGVPILNKFNVCALRALSRIVPAQRWAALRKCGSLDHISESDLDFAYIEKYSTKPRKLADYMPPVEAWPIYYNMAAPIGVKSHPKGFPLGTYLAVSQRMGVHHERLDESFLTKAFHRSSFLLKNMFSLHNEDYWNETLHRIAKITLFFRNDTLGAIRFIDKHGLPEIGKIDDLDTIKRNEWLALCVRYPDLFKKSNHFLSVQEWNHGQVPKSRADYLRIASSIYLEQIKDSESVPMAQELADLFIKYEIPCDQFAQHAQYLTEVKDSCRMPKASIQIRGFSFRKLAPDDPLSLVLGHASSCCQHICGAAKQCVIHGRTSPYSAFYVLFDSENNVAAQFWAWESDNGAIVIDSVESSLNGRMLNRALNALSSALQRWNVGDRNLLLGQAKYGKNCATILKCSEKLLVGKPFDAPDVYRDSSFEAYKIQRFHGEKE